MNDPSVDLAMRVYASEILLPYTQPRLGALPADTVQPAGQAPGATA